MEGKRGERSPPGERPKKGGGEMSAAVESMGRVLEKVDRKEGKYLTFTLAHEDYGIGILKVKEIIGMLPVTKVPRCPDFIKGVINLRGKVIPVIDLRMRFDVEASAYTERTCIVVVETEAESRRLMIGLVVDSVSEVLSIKSEDIEETPRFGSRVALDYILGMAKISGKVKILLDIDKVLGKGDLETVV